MANTKNFKKKFLYFKENWAVAEIEVSYKIKHKANFKVTDPEKAANVLRAMWDEGLINIQEQFCVLFLNSVKEVLGFKIINTGMLTHTEVDINLIIALALKCRANSVILAHNHPSQKVKPSYNDIKLHETIENLLNLHKIEVDDSIIISQNEFYSLTNQNLYH